MKESTSVYTNHGPFSLNSCGKCLFAVVYTGSVNGVRPLSPWSRVFC
jgi:hypothetical protein